VEVERGMVGGCRRGRAVIVEVPACSRASQLIPGVGPTEHNASFKPSLHAEDRKVMKQSFRTALFIASALLMMFGAAGYTFAVVPDLHGDLVRPTVLGGTVLYLYFSAIAMFGFALMVSAAAVQATRGLSPARIPLAVVAVIYTAFGVLAFSRSHNPHHLGPLAMGVLLGAALAIPDSAVAPHRACTRRPPGRS
jgi:hypothetical protein